MPLSKDSTPSHKKIEEADSGTLQSERSSEPDYEVPPTRLPWGAIKDRTEFPENIHINPHVKPGEFILQTLFADFTVLTQKIIMDVLNSSDKQKSFARSLQRGEHPKFDQLLSSMGSMAEHCLPSLLQSLFVWYSTQINTDEESLTLDSKTKPRTRVEKDIKLEKRELAIEFIYCLVLIEVLKQLSFHPGHDDLIQQILNQAFRHFKYKEGIQGSSAIVNNNIIADLFAEVLGVLTQSRFTAVRKRFMLELKELRAKDQNPYVTNSIISLLMGMKFFRVKMHPIEEFQACIQFLTDLGNYFLEVKDKDIRHALAGLFVEILLPVAAVVNNEVNVPVLKNFVEMLYTPTLDLSNKKKHSLALFPMVTCLLCVSQKAFFLSNWPYFLTMCLSHLKDRDPKMARVALESLYRLVWVYMIRVKCESNAATTSRLHSIVNSLFPKGYKMVVPRDTPLNIFVKIIQFIAQERLDFAMKEIINDLLSVRGKILTPERMSIGLRSFLVIADSLQQKEGDPPMPQTMAVMPSGNTLRFKKTFLTKFLSDETAKTIGVSGYYPHVRKAFNSILKLLDQQVGKVMLKTKTENINRDPEEIITGERKPKIDLFRTCVAAVPRLLPDGMSSYELIDLLARLTVHMDDELGKLAFQSLQNIVADLPQWRNDILRGFVQFIQREVSDTQPQLLEHCNRRLFSLITQWKSSAASHTAVKEDKVKAVAALYHVGHRATFHELEGFALVMLCSCIPPVRKLAVVILREVRNLFNVLNIQKDGDPCVLDVMDSACGTIVERVLPHLPLAERASLLSAASVDFQWLADRTSIIWTSVGYHDINETNTTTVLASNFDPWIECMSIFMSQTYVVGQCTKAISSTWPLLFNRLKVLFAQVDPSNPVNDNRTTTLLGRPVAKKTTNERDPYMNLWVNYVVMGCCMAPAKQTTEPRAASPDLSNPLPDTSTDKIDGRIVGSATAKELFRILVQQIKCDAVDMRETIVSGLGHINPEAFRDLVDELLPMIKEAIDRKQENIKRRKKRDTLRLCIAKIFRTMAENGIFAQSPSGVTDGPYHALNSTFVDYIEGARLYLESDNDKDLNTLKEIRLHFSEFIRNLIHNTPVEKRNNFLSKDLRHNLFYLFNGWSGTLSHSFGMFERRSSKSSTNGSLEISAVQSMSAVLCCGPVFDPAGLNEDGYVYEWLNRLLRVQDDKIKPKIYKLAQETMVLLLEYNTETVPVSLLDWVIDRCYTGSPEVADGCFTALARVFSTREYPCDQVAMLNVTLLHCGCPRVIIKETAVNLFHVLYKRFFMDTPLLPDATETQNEAAQSDHQQHQKDLTDLSNLQQLLISGPDCRSQMFISDSLAKLHPDLTMPMFSEITLRYQTSSHNIRQMLLHYLVPWLHNLELVDPNLPPANPLTNFLNRQQDSQQSDYRKPPLKGEGWGSPQATDMVLNNLMFITAKFGEELCEEIQCLWSSLVMCWPNNLRVIMRYIVVVTGMAPRAILPHAKRVIKYLAKAKPERVLDELMNELQTTDPLTFNIERTQTPPFYRLTSLKKHSTVTTIDEHHPEPHHPLPLDKGQIHTKRHSAEDPAKLIPAMSGAVEDSCIASDATYSTRSSVPVSIASTRRIESDIEEVPSSSSPRKRYVSDPSVPYPLPMPAYGGYFAPLSDMLPESSDLPNPPYQRCNLAVMLLTDLVLEGVNVEWAAHLPLMLHIVLIGADHSRMLIHEHCKRLLLNLLLMFSHHNDHFGTARVLLKGRSGHTKGRGNSDFNFVDGDWSSDSGSVSKMNPMSSVLPDDVMTLPDIQSLESTEQAAKTLIDFLISRRCRPLWRYEDITAKVHSIRSAQQIDHLLTYLLFIFNDSLPHAQIQRRWAQVALQLALSCSSRHYASRSFQILRALQVPLSSNMLSDILSRLVETVAEQGEDMQGYVTEIILTLQSAVDTFNIDLKPLDFAKELFLSTPNLNKDAAKLDLHVGRKSATVAMRSSPPSHYPSYPLNNVMRRNITSSPTGMENRDEHGTYKVKDTDSLEQRQVKALSLDASALPRSHSAQSLKQLQGDPVGQEDKLTLLAQLFWIAVSLLESDYEHEFLLAVNLLEKVLKYVHPEREECREKLEKIQQQINWRCFPGVQSLALKGCTNTLTAEASWVLLSRLTLCINASVIDPTQCIGFPMNVIAILPYLMEHYEQPNQMCIDAADHISQTCMDHPQQLTKLATVMNLYSKGTFGNNRFQWTKCVVKYLYDVYSNLSTSMIGFLVEVLDKGPVSSQTYVMEILYCILHYIDITASPMPSINSDLLRLIVKYIEGNHWKEALQILKLCVTRSSTLVAAPPSMTSSADSASIVVSLQAHTSFADVEYSTKKELPGRTMDFKYDVSQIPVIPITEQRPSLSSGGSGAPPPGSTVSLPLAVAASGGMVARRDGSATDSDIRLDPSRLSINDMGATGWKKPQLSQGRTRERLVNLLISYGQRVGLPKSPSVIFSQSSDTIERQASMVSSSEDSASTDGLSCDRKLDDTSSVEQQLQVFRDFDFLDIELEYLESEGGDKFNWGVKRHSVEIEEPEEGTIRGESTSTTASCKDDESDDDVTLYQVSASEEYPMDLASTSTITLQNALLGDQRNRRHSSPMSGSSQSIQSGLSDFDMADLSPSIASSSFSKIDDEIERVWRSHVQHVMTDPTASYTNATYHIFARLIQTTKYRLEALSKESLQFLYKSTNVRLMADQLSSCLELIQKETHFPLVYTDIEAMRACRIIQKHKFAVLENNECFETYLLRRDQTTECLENVKTMMKLPREGSGNAVEDCIAEQKQTLCRCLYKQLFQFIKLYEGYVKLLTSLHEMTKIPQVLDLTEDIVALRSQMLSCQHYSSGRKDDPPESPLSLGKQKAEVAAMDYLYSHNITKALDVVRATLAQFDGELYSLDPVDEVEMLLFIYCRSQSESKPGVVVSSMREHDLSTVYAHLMEIEISLASLSSNASSTVQLNTSEVDLSITPPESSTL